MRSAIRARRRVIGTRCSARAPRALGMGTGAAGALDAGGGAASLADRKFTTSDFDTRPSRPDPVTAFGSTLFSSTTRLAAGLSLAAAASGLAASRFVAVAAVVTGPLDAAVMAGALPVAALAALAAVALAAAA